MMSGVMLKLPVLLLLASVTTFSSAQTQPGTRSSDWSQFRGDPSLTGVAATIPPSSLELLWSYETGDAIDSSAAVADGVVYVGVGNGDLLALDLDSGELKWAYSTGSFIMESSPAVGQDTVYVGDLDGIVHAVSLHDGEAAWTFATDGEIKASPVVVDDLVLIGSYDTHLYALDANDGSLRWKIQTDNMVHATPAVADGLAFIVGCDGIFRAVRVADGTEAYQIVAGAYTAASPLLDGDRAYFGTFEHEVLALDLAGREVVWRYRNPNREFPYYSSAALAQGRIILGGRDKFVHAIDAATGQSLWTFETRARVDSSPAIAGGRVYIGSSDGRLYVLDAATGSKLWEFNTGADLTASPAIASGRVVIGSTDGVLYVFG